MDITWSDDIETVDWQELAALYRAALGAKDPDALRLAFTNSRYRFIVREDARIIGAGRVLSDGVDVAYVADIAFLPSHQGRGLGKEMIRRLLALVRGH
ncbi:MAG TPA: GNAT family N-acetyltransferase, partial [Telluria sp.]|nr:GNAT family N-acetyltransferase [Telluria sp.]